jgi:hypothetical protein
MMPPSKREEQMKEDELKVSEASRSFMKTVEFATPFRLAQ